jgi:putative hydrolase of the HAD superfamily
MIKFIIVFILAISSLSATSKAVIFDYGDVLTFHNSDVIVEFYCETFQLTQEEFEGAKLAKKISGESDDQFWTSLAYKKGITLPIDWQEKYKEVIRKSLGADERMYRLVDEIKKKNIKVGLFSNIRKDWVKTAQSYGLFQPFDPCIFACDIGVEKPDPKAYQILLDTLNLSATEIVFIDDRPENVEAAQIMGIDAIKFESSEQIREELQKRELI